MKYFVCVNSMPWRYAKMLGCKLLFIGISIIEGREYRDGGGKEIGYYKLYRTKLKDYFSAA